MLKKDNFIHSEPHSWFVYCQYALFYFAKIDVTQLLKTPKTLHSKLENIYVYVL